MIIKSIIRDNAVYLSVDNKYRSVPEMALSEKIVLITGGSSGIGKSCVEEILKNGAKGVVIADINADLGEQAVKEFTGTYGDGKVIFVKTDTSDKDSFDAAFQKAVEKFNNIDILVNAAGIMDEINWERQLKVNLIGATYGCLLAINKYFPKYRGSAKRYIINISSIVGIVPMPSAPHYAASKCALLGLTRSLGINKTIAEQGICIMCVCPGATETPMLLDPPETKLVYTEVWEEESALYSVSQEPVAVAKGVIEILNKPENGSSWLVNEGVLSKINFPSIEDMITPA